MSSVLWRGSWMTRARVVSGLVLFVYVFFHFFNIGLGLVSPEAMDAMQDARKWVTRSFLGGFVLYTALVVHALLSLSKLATRATLRMPLWEAVQTALGLIIPFLLAAHITFTRAANQQFGVNDEFGYLIKLIWGTTDGWIQSLLLLIVWVHGCIGLHFWLRPLPAWRRWTPAMTGIAVLIPGFALAGFVTEGRRITAVFQDAAAAAALRAEYNWPNREAVLSLITQTAQMKALFWGILGLAVVVYVGRKILAGRRSVRVRYVDGPEVSSPKGMTLLEISRANGIPHTALCGGRGRCTTCRVVVEDGQDLLHPPSEAELKSLQAVNAPPNTRLACQIRPTEPSTVFRVFRPDGRRKREHASQGREQVLAVLFLDMRGFTARTTGQLPYDVVFLLNRFFDAVVPAITGAGGTVDKYLGDGLMAVFEAKDAKTSARAALEAAAGIGGAVMTFNQTLVAEKAQPVRIGMGIHLGDLVLGEIGAAGNAPRTIIGDTVNTASRLEGKTKELSVELLVSEPLLQAAGYDTSHLELTSLELRGVARPLPSLPVRRARELQRVLQETGEIPEREAESASP